MIKGDKRRGVVSETNTKFLMKRADEGTMTLKCKWPHHMKDNNKEKGSFIPSPSFFKEIETILQLRIVTESSLNNVSTAGG